MRCTAHGEILKHISTNKVTRTLRFRKAFTAPLKLLYVPPVSLCYRLSLLDTAEKAGELYSAEAVKYITEKHT